LGEKYQQWRELFGETTTDPDCGFNLPKNIPLRHFHLACPGNENDVLRGYFYSEDITPAFMEELLKLPDDQQKEVMRRLTDRGMVVLHFYSRQFPPGSPKRVELDRLVREWVLDETRVTAQARERGFNNNHSVRGENRVDIPKTDFALFGTEGEKIWESLKRNGSLEEYYYARPFLEGEELALESSRLSPRDRKLLEKELRGYDIVAGRHKFIKDQFKRSLANYILDINKLDKYEKDVMHALELLLRHWDELVKAGYLEMHGWLKDRTSLSRLSPENQKIFGRILTKSLYLEWGDQILEAIEGYDDYWREKFATLEFSTANAGQFRDLTDFNEKIFSILAPVKSDREWWKKRFEHPVDSLGRTNEYLKLTSLYDIWVKNGVEFKAASEEDARIIELAEITRDYRRFGFNSLPNHKKLLIMELNRLLLLQLSKSW